MGPVHMQHYDKNSVKKGRKSDTYLIIIDGMTVENKGKLILTEIFPSVQKHDI
jgi:hypothetical protein